MGVREGWILGRLGGIALGLMLAALAGASASRTRDRAW